MDQSLASILQSYPRCRPQLSERHAAVYVREYQRNRSADSGLAAVVASLERWMHKRVAGDKDGERILELGAGTLNHTPYETTVSFYDVIEPFRVLWENSPRLDHVSDVYADISEVPRHKRYDRILSVAVLEHLIDLPRTVAQCALFLDRGGTFRAGIPTEGGFLWGLAWRATTGVSFRLRTGLSYRSIMRHEHVNTADEILAVVQYFFRRVELCRFPFPAKHLSFYTALNATSPDRDRCLAYSAT
jgi:hypothetical protein